MRASGTAGVGEGAVAGESDRVAEAVVPPVPSVDKGARPHAARQKTVVRMITYRREFVADIVNRYLALS